MNRTYLILIGMALLVVGGLALLTVKSPNVSTNGSVQNTGTTAVTPALTPLAGQTQTSPTAVTYS